MVEESVMWEGRHSVGIIRGRYSYKLYKSNECPRRIEWGRIEPNLWAIVLSKIFLWVHFYSATEEWETIKYILHEWNIV